MSTKRGVVGKVRGFTIVELMITLVIVAIGIALAVPTFENVTQRRQTTAKAEQLASFLAYARSEAVKSSEQISVQLTWTDANDWCIGADEGTTGCDCTTADACQIGATEYRLDSTGETKSKMQSHSADTLFVFDPVRGVKRAGDLVNHAYKIQSDSDAYALQVNVSPTGRVSVCNPTPGLEVPGYQDCPASSAIPPVIVPPSP